MKILVIIVTYNAMQWAERCFDNLRNSTVKPDVFVVDNGSTDGTQAYIQEHYPEVIFQQSKVNLGFGKANNLGLQYALDNGYDYVYLLNQDAWVMEDTFEKLNEISKRNPEYGILSPFQMNEDVVNIDNSFFNIASLSGKINEIMSDFNSGNNDNIYSVPYIMAAHWFVTAKCLKSVGGFSPCFPHYGEDNNYANRTLYKGFKIGIVPSLRVVHDRADRRLSTEKILYLRYIYCIIKLSNTSRMFKNSLAACIMMLSLDIFKYKSLKPFNYLIKLLREFNSIVSMRKISMEKEGAFLITKV